MSRQHATDMPPTIHVRHTYPTAIRCAVGMPCMGRAPPPPRLRAFLIYLMVNSHRHGLVPRVLHVDRYSPSTVWMGGGGVAGWGTEVAV